ncbi:hypothetical protein JX265_002503 [Neoarthrinium moseri]|uniref:Extracellular serine-rich protein n=1 Tax=Neoarthrinium moseri TaxID=1658444 RepID=A0A9Q0AQG4_9PEZI|nr:uncharacterized protein JN550_000317 [Neoarthrinium moseri]KAI1854864.1 hypothetical protein JX266_000982 [Neoarthrinium moseri]KAI1878135.1 hypothetical protein JN550_000317 [Neoarthrinium moseri]KAI1879549.1 hypothetical protein JX265_002503 [Neoarthrinium moseri]
MFTTVAAALLLAVSITAAPTATTGSNIPARTLPRTGVTHTIAAGRGALSFEPANVVAQKGEVIEWHFAPKNHSVAQSSFGNPCNPLEDGTGFFAGFNFRTDNVQADNVFQLVIEDPTKPIWYYCPQTEGDHCQKGMVGVINQNFNSNDATLAKYRAKAAESGHSVVPSVEQGGKVIPVPDPLAGF